MAEEQLREIIEAMRARIQAELDGQIQTLTTRHEEALAKARQDAQRAAEAEVEKRWSAKLEEMHVRMQAELDAQIKTLTTHHEQALAQARQEAAKAAEVQADARWSSRLDATVAEWSARLQGEVAAARTEAEKQFAAEAMRARVEAEKAGAEAASRARAEAEKVAAEAASRARAEAEEVAAEAASRARAEAEKTAAETVARARVAAEKAAAEAVSRAHVEADKAAAEAATRARQELEQAVAAERQRSQAALDEERRRAEERLQEAVRRGDERLQQTVEAAREVERRKVEEESKGRIPAAGVDTGSVLDSTRVIDTARTLSDVLATLVRASSGHAPRVALYIVNGTRLDEWTASGDPPTHASLDLGQDAGLLGAVVRTGATARSAGEDARLRVPAFADLPVNRQAIAVPLVLGGQAVAVLYADEGNAASSQAAPRWTEIVELLVRYAAATIAHMTAIRTLQLVQGSNGHSRPTSEETRVDEDSSARRYAKLLISEIKLYNEGAVRAGRENRDLRQRLAGEIERARRLYEERVPPSVTARGFYFHQELVQTLAGGDPSLLGG